MHRSSGRSPRNRVLLSNTARANDRLLNIQRFSGSNRYVSRSNDSLDVSRAYASSSSFERTSPRSSMRQHRRSSNLSTDNDDDDNNNNHADRRLKGLGDKTENVIGSIDVLRDKHEHLTTSFDDFESNLRKTREKMDSLLNKHSDVNEKLQNGGSIHGDDGKHWEYFQRQNKLLNLAVSKLCQKEGIDVADLLNEEAQHWRLRRNPSEDDGQES